MGGGKKYDRIMGVDGVEVRSLEGRSGTVWRWWTQISGGEGPVG